MKQDMEVLSGLFTMLYETNSFALQYLVHLLTHILGVVEGPTGRLVVGVRPRLLGVPVAIVCMGVTSLFIIPCHCQNTLYRGIPKLEMPLELPGCRCSSQSSFHTTECSRPKFLDPEMAVCLC